MECQHTGETIILVIARKCLECGSVLQYRPDSKIANAMLAVLQGKLPADIAAQGDWTDEEKAILLRIVPCKHDRRTIGHCGDVEKEICQDCGRRWTNPAQWILRHGGQVEHTKREVIDPR